MMLKLLLPPLIIVCIFSAVGMFGLLPPALTGIIAIIGAFVLFLLPAVLVSGPAAAFVEAKLKKAMVLAIMKRDKTAIFGAVVPKAGMVRTKRHGAYTVMPESVYLAGGVPVAIAPEYVGFTVKPEHAQLVDKLQANGAKNVEDMVELDEYGFPKGLKQSELATKKYPVEPYTVSFDQLYQYVQEAASPAHQDANIQLGIAQGLAGAQTKNYSWLVFAGLLVLFVFVGLWLLLQYHPPAPEVIVKMIPENAPPLVG